jgi:hypothetical protein
MLSDYIYTQGEKDEMLNRDSGISADQVVGNRLKMKKPTTVYLDYAGSPNTKVWPKGYLSPKIYSWIMHNGDLYWMMGEDRPEYVKHATGQFKLIHDYGAPSTNPSHSQGSLFDLFGSADNGIFGQLDSILSKVLIIGGIGAGIYFLGPFLPAIRKEMKDLAGDVKQHF